MKRILSEALLTPRLLLLTLGGDGPLTSYGANALALAGEDGTLLVDPLIAPAHARLVAEAVARRGFPPVTHVALTHHHTDHALGAGLFAAAGAQVIAHRRAAALMAAQHAGILAARRRDPALAALFADAAPHAPAVCFDGAHAVELGGGVTAECRHLGPCHTPGDVVVVMPSEATAALGDLVFRGYHFNYEEADLAGIDRALAAAAALPVARWVPGHGPPGGPEVVAEQVRYHAEVARLVASAPHPAAAREAIRSAFPGHQLEGAIASALARRS